MPVHLGAVLVAEFVGTFALCCGGILTIDFAGSSVIIAVAVAHGRRRGSKVQVPTAFVIEH